MEEAFQRVLKLCNAGLTEERGDADIIIEKLFWDAFLRGGIQAGVWIVETVLSGIVERIRECR